ncbi:SDR family NAD(P)-dependent oxidoreductase [Mesotoga sp.]|uniref:NAD(P)-dependent oxidoreductase n=2 Tax=Mesotoga infera TaxID=1236046 RepID=A0A3D3TP92_9BACT|nr:NAD(P)-dependent oxidoreductase [Mesotoga infera]
MNGYFEKKVAVVTGAASGIGLGLTEEMLSRGAKAVFMADVSQENLDRESERLNSKYEGEAVPFLTDVTKEEQVEKLIKSARKYEGHLDFVFNNAGIGMTIPTEMVTLEIWKKVIDINLWGVIYGTYQAIPIMREQKSGHIVNTASITGLVPVPYQALYACAKSAVKTMTESLYYELFNEGLKFSVVCPGNVRTAIFGGLTPPPDSVSVEEAVSYIFEKMEKGDLLIVFPQKMRDFNELYRTDREKFDEFAFNMAAERRENYRTKGTYY